ncbi:hypothetical protein BJV74DRAFT_842836 [Russula compacta]|nr:hypothetical protein BJV74DRAFT_842836 [Russula compacta]
MVAIRRTPAPPQFDSQDSDSSATTTSSSKAKALHHASQTPEQSSPLANGRPREDPHDGLREDSSRETGAPRAKKNRGGRKNKNGKKRKGKNANYADVLLRYLLLFFTIYSLSVCPQDTELKSPLCRGLSEYRRLILEPYIFPAVNKALSHPSILPYVERAMPYANQAIQIAQPVVLRTQLEWNHRIAPQWNKVIVPQYNNAVIHPYLSAVEEACESLLGPHVRTIVSTTNKLQRAIRPYVLIAADRTYSAYQTARPYLRPVLLRVKHSLKQCLVLLRAQRRQFVDPHVAKIWERVKELSRGGDETVTVQSLSAHSVSLTAVETQVDSPVVRGLSAGLDKMEPTSPSVEDPAPPLSETLVISTPVDQPLQSIGVAEEVASEENTLLPTAAPSSTPEVLPSFTEDVSLEAFYADIGLDNEEPEAEEPEEEVATEIPSLDEEQLEELRLQNLANTAEKRRDIMSRHANAVKQKKKALRKALVALRKAAVQELQTNTEVQSAIEQLVENAEKFLRGSEAYINNLKTESRTTDEKVALWTKVLAKVEAKFTENLRHTEDVVNGWYTRHLEEEIREVKQVSEEVREIADNAQTDVGYDYMWLADVTYHDWQRYHALVGKSNNFTDLAMSIQNGSHPSPPINPISDAMQELQTELQDVIAGFETRYRRIKRHGFKAFDSPPSDKIGEEEVEQVIESPEPPEASIFPTPGDQYNLGTPVVESESPVAAPQVSILPIPEDESDPVTPIFGSEFPVIGRGKAEVEEAFARGGAGLDQEDSHEVGRSTADETNEAGPSLVTSTIVPPSVSPLHAEL